MNFTQDDKGEIRPEENDHGHSLPPLRQTDVPPPGPLREVPRLHRLSGMQTYDQHRPGWSAGCRSRPGEKRATPSVKNAENRWSSKGAVSGPSSAVPAIPSARTSSGRPRARPASRSSRCGPKISDVPLRQVREADGRQAGPVREISRLHGLSGLPEHHEVQGAGEGSGRLRTAGVLTRRSGRSL